MTEKLYYKDAYISRFSSRVISSTKRGDGNFDTVLLSTAFFPEEGGQSADTGVMAGGRVLDVYEKDGVVYHITDKEHSGVVECEIDFSERYDKMQCHTAEHIVCGIIHSLYGYDNVGFHLGADEVTFDISAPVDREMLDRVEELANKAVFDMIEVQTFFPSAESLSALSYRSKLELTEGVRIVKIGEVDSCACCAPHVKNTGEIGLIKLLDHMKHRGGTRIWLAAGRRALLDYRKKYESVKKISALLSVPQGEVALGLEKYIAESERVKYELKAAKISAARAHAEMLPARAGNSVVLLEDYSQDELRAFVNVYKDKVSGELVALSGTEGDYKYLILSGSQPFSSRIKEINSSLCGRGGGRDGAAEGRFACTLAEIEEYFKK